MRTPESTEPPRDLTGSTEPSCRVVEVDAACPACGNVNRAARRRCRECGGTGKVKKTLPS